MKVFKNYSEYLSEKKNYEPWKDSRNIQEAKRLAYIKQNSIPKEQWTSDIQRAEAVLNSIDIMDEFSQARAEDMEVVTNQVKGWISELGVYGTMGVGALLLLSKSVKNNLKEVFTDRNYSKVPKLILPAIALLAPILGSIVFASVWGAGTETKASRLGRAEAINTTLYSPKQFAELTEEQEKEVDRIASDIYLTPEQAKSKQKTTRGFGIFKSIKTIFVANEQEKQTIDYINYRINADQNSFDKYELDEKEIHEAKRDQQLIQNLVEKIDIASQDYAEDVELAVEAVTTTALAGGILTGFVANKIIKKMPNLGPYSILISGAVGFAIPLLAAIFGTKLQKQASRVGRFKVKQDFLKNPEKLIYVDDEKIKGSDDLSELKYDKKPGFFKFLLNVVKNNKEYNKYMKSEYVESKKRAIAKEQIEITPEQTERAIQLQTNVFKMFNKLDEKSQNFSESTEAIGEMLSSTIVTLLGTIGMGLTALGLSKSKANRGKSTVEKILISYIPLIASILIANVLNVFITKEQKKASKVANMLAIKDLDDYRNFVDYDKHYKNENI